MEDHPDMFGHKYVIITAAHNLFKAREIKGKMKILDWARRAKMELGPSMSPHIKFECDCGPENMLKTIKDENLPVDSILRYHDIAILKLPQKDEKGDQLLPKLDKYLSETGPAPKISKENIESYRELFRHDYLGMRNAPK